jgi:hypothetical protein
MSFSYDNLPASTFGGGAMLALPFLQQNIATSQSSVALKISDVAGVTQFTMPYPGYVLGVAARANATVTAGTIRFAPTVNGATIFSVVNAATSFKSLSTLKTRESVYDSAGARKFAAGDGLGCKVSTSASYAPGTDDWTVMVLIEVDPAL